MNRATRVGAFICTCTGIEGGLYTRKQLRSNNDRFDWLYGHVGGDTGTPEPPHFMNESATKQLPVPITALRRGPFESCGHLSDHLLHNRWPLYAADCTSPDSVKRGRDRTGEVQTYTRLSRDEFEAAGCVRNYCGENGPSIRVTSVLFQTSR